MKSSKQEKNSLKVDQDSLYDKNSELLSEPSINFHDSSKLSNQSDSYYIEEKEEEEEKIYDLQYEFLGPRLQITKYMKSDIIENNYSITVYKIIEKSTNKEYAANIFQQKNKLSIEEFRKNLTILSQISHPAIIKFIGYSPIDFSHKRNPIIITEFCRNGTLNDILELERKGEKIEGWDWTKKLINVYGIASALKYLHSQDIFH